jgi:predicted transcriptional regulator
MSDSQREYWLKRKQEREVTMKVVQKVHEDMSEMDKFADGFRAALNNPSQMPAMMSEED